MYEVADAAELALSAGGILMGAIGGSLYFVEKGAKGKVEEELKQAQAASKAKDAVIEDLQQQLEAAKKVGRSDLQGLQCATACSSSMWPGPWLAVSTQICCLWPVSAPAGVHPSQ